MSQPTPPGGGEGGAGNPVRTDSPKTPRGGPLRDRVSFFEQLWSGGNRSASMDDLQGEENKNSQTRRSTSNLAVNVPRSSSRTSDSSFEESFERLVEEGELNGSKVEEDVYLQDVDYDGGRFIIIEKENHSEITLSA